MFANKMRAKFGTQMQIWLQTTPEGECDMFVIRLLRQLPMWMSLFGHGTCFTKRKTYKCSITSCITKSMAGRKNLCIQIINKDVISVRSIDGQIELLNQSGILTDTSSSKSSLEHVLKSLESCQDLRRSSVATIVISVLELVCILIYSTFAFFVLKPVHVNLCLWWIDGCCICKIMCYVMCISTSTHA